MISVNQTNAYKRKYHPLIILLYHSKMLSREQLRQFPSNTLRNWKNFEHENYFGHEMVQGYIDQFDDIRKVYSRKYLKRSLRLLILLSDAYTGVIREIEQNKKLLRRHAKNITSSISKTAALSGEKISLVAKVFGVSRTWFYRHRERIQCGLSKTKKCFRQYPNQLSFTEISVIEEIISVPENRNKTKATLYYTALRKGKIACSYAAFSSYATHFGYNCVKKKKQQNRRKGFKATRVFEWLHVDVTYIPTIIDGVQKVAFIKDNFSGALLHYGSTDQSADSNFITELFKVTFEHFGFYNANHSINILSDGGPENKGRLLEWVNAIDAPPLVRKITACSAEFPFSNAMSESTHRIYKSEFMQGRLSNDRTQHLIDLKRFYQQYNYERFPVRLFGLSPMEVVELGLIPNRSRFKEHFEEARKKRIEDNRNFNDCQAFQGCGVLRLFVNQTK